VRAWKLLFLFPKCVLRLQPEIRGGKKKKLKRNETLRTGLLERLKRWNEGQVNVLWAEARKLFSGGERQAVTVSLANNIRRATECAQDARYGKAVASLLSLGLCPTNDENLEAMKSKHPEAALPVLPSGPLPDAVSFDEGAQEGGWFPHRFCGRSLRHTAAASERHLIMPQQSCGR